MYKPEIDKFLKTCNGGIVELMEKLEMNQQTINEVSTNLRERLIATLLENDIITAENYSDKGSNSENSSNSDKKEDDLLERSNHSIKNLIQQLLDKDNEIKALKAQLQMTTPQQ